MPKDFDEFLSTDRTFTVRGETFEWIETKPEVLALWDPESVPTNGKEAEATWGLRLLDAQVKLFLNPEDQKRWDELRARDEQPVTQRQMIELVKWLVAEQAERPTETPSPSDSGRGRTAASSKGA